MAFTPPAPGSIASRPTIKKGGVRGADESPEDFSQRMATRQASPVQASPGATPTRRDNILTARADGSFDAKRNAFNAGTAQHGRSMDEAGNITGATAAFAAPRPASQLIPGRSAGSMVMPPAAPAPAPAAAPSPAPQIPNTPAAPAPAPSPGGIRPPAQAATPIGPPSTATASAGKMSLTPQPAPAPASRMAQRQQRPQSPNAAPPPPSPAVPPQPGAPAPAPAARKPGMINDGQGFKPASEVNASLRAAQDARAGRPSVAPPPPKPAIVNATPPPPAPPPPKPAQPAPAQPAAPIEKDLAEMERRAMETEPDEVDATSSSPSDSYVSKPGNKSVISMPSGNADVEAAKKQRVDDAAAKEKRRRDDLAKSQFRTPYNPHKPASFLIGL